MGYLPYYLVWAVAAYVLQHPLLLVAGVVVFLLRRKLPNVYLWAKHARHVKRLKAEIAHNADNVTARRDLAKIWLEKKRPRRALPLVLEARRREPDSVELAFLHGKALLEAGRPEEALGPLVEAAHRDERFQYGDAYLVAGRSLYALGRNAEAEDAFARYAGINSSSVEGRVRLACARRALRDVAGARQAMRDAVDTFRHLPRFRRRPELWWYLRARLMSLGLA